MKMKLFFLPVLLSVLTISVVSCSKDDDKLEYHLVFSKSSCEVMQGSSVTIDLTAHENTTLDIKNSDIIDAVYTWGFDEYKAKIEIKGKQKGETEIVVTDHETGESATVTVTVKEFQMPCLAVKQLKGNIFDLMNFYLYNEDSTPINSNSLSTICDSIVWTIDGVNGSFRVFEHEDWVSTHLTFEWGHCFKYSGDYKTNLTAWKDNKAIYRHQLDITITDEKDFLAYNWSDIIKDSQAFTGYADVLNSSPGLMTTYGLSGTVPFAEVRVFGSDFVQSYHTLYDFFCGLYSSPTYTDKTHKMWQLYDELFSEQKEYPNAYPVAIWVEERANIVLLLLDESTESPGYLIYAEPNRL